MLTIMGAAISAAGLIWPPTRNWQNGLRRRGWSLGELEATCEVLRKEIRWDLRNQAHRELFLKSYREKVRNGGIPHSPEWERQVFDQDDLGRSFENARRASITLWYIMGQLECSKLQAALLEYLYRLYVACRKSTRGLRAELGPRAGLPQAGPTR